MWRWVDILVPWLIPLSAIVAWQLASDAGALPAQVLPAPVHVLRTTITMSQSGELWRHIAISCGRAFAGFVAGGAIGFGLGVLTGSSSVADRLLDTTIQMLRTIPHLAMIPLVILWFGIGETAKVFLVAIGVLFPIYVNTHHGLRTVDPALIEMGRVYGLGLWTSFLKIQLPGALPSILVGIRYALGVMWLTLIVAESVSAASGIGYLTIHAREFLRTDVILLCIIIYAGLGKCADALARYGERICLPWRPTFAKPVQSPTIPRKVF